MRRSIYTFDGRPVRDEDLLEILEEGKALSNAEDNKAWHFTVVQNKRLLDEVREAINRQLEKSTESNIHILPEVPLLMIISSCMDNVYAVDAANMVFGSMMLVAEKHGMGSCWFSAAAKIFAEEEGKRVFKQIGVPADYHPLCVGTFGYKPIPGGAGSLLSNDNVINIVK